MYVPSKKKSQSQNKKSYFYQNFRLREKFEPLTADDIIDKVQEEKYKKLRDFFEDMVELVISAGLAVTLAQKENHRKLSG